MKRASKRLNSSITPHASLAAPFRVLWAALVGLYDEMITLLRGNLAWFALSVPFYVLLLLALVPWAGAPATAREGESFVWPFVLAGWLLLLLPTPGSVGLGELARVTAGRESPAFFMFGQAARRHWRLAVGMFAVGFLVLAVLSANVVFYATVAEGWIRLASIVWLYGLLFWLGMHIYLVPLLLHVAGPRFVDLYRRAVFLTLAHPFYTVMLVLFVALVGLLSLVLLPLYPLVTGAYVALIQAYAFRHLRRRHGDLVEEEAEAA